MSSSTDMYHGAVHCISVPVPRQSDLAGNSGHNPGPFDTLLKAQLSNPTEVTKR